MRLNESLDFFFLKNNRSNCGTNAFCEAEKPLQVAVERSPALIEFEGGGHKAVQLKGLEAQFFFFIKKKPFVFRDST